MLELILEFKKLINVNINKRHINRNYHKKIKLIKWGIRKVHVIREPYLKAVPM